LASFGKHVRVDPPVGEFVLFGNSASANRVQTELASFGKTLSHGQPVGDFVLFGDPVAANRIQPGIGFVRQNALKWTNQSANSFCSVIQLVPTVCKRELVLFGKSDFADLPAQRICSIR